MHQRTERHAEGKCDGGKLWESCRQERSPPKPDRHNHAAAGMTVTSVKIGEPHSGQKFLSTG
jgi:hypothetical protein